MNFKRNKVRASWLCGLLACTSTAALAVDDGSQMNSPFRVNFAGYMPQAEKIGLYLSSNQGPINWSLSGTTCQGSEDTFVANDKSSGDSFYIVDFSECTDPATNVRLSIGGDTSAAFDISDDPYGDLKFEFFDYFKDHEGSATFSQTKNNWGSMNVSFRYVKDAGDNGAYPTNTAEAAWALINMLETYPAINTYYSSNFGSRSVYEQLDILTEQFEHVMNNATGLAVPKLHTNVNTSWASCSPHSGGTCIAEPETKATFATARTMAAMARIHASFGTSAEATAAFALAEQAYTNASTLPFVCNQADAFGGEGGMYPDNDNTNLWRDPKSNRDNCVADRNNTEDDAYASIVELYIAAEKLGLSSKAASYKSQVLSHSRFNEASSYWWGAVVMEANLSLLSNEAVHSIDLSTFKTNLIQKANEIYAQSAKGYPGVTWDPNSDQWDSGDDDHIDNNVRWGSHRMALNDARIMMAAAELSSDKDAARFARGAVKVLDHIGGVNAINLAMYTAAGYSNIENAVTRTHDGANASDSWAGKMVLGPNNWTNANDPDMPAYGSQPGLKMFALTGTGWSSREISIDANASLVPVAYFADQIANGHFLKDPIGGGNATQTPAAPTTLTASNPTASSLSLSWTDNAGSNDDAELGFRIYVSTGTTKPTTASLTVGANITTATVSSLTALTTYNFWIEAYNSIGTSSTTTTSATTTDQSSAVNILSNGDFEAGTLGWDCEQPGGFASCAVSNGQYVVSISDGGTATWHVQPQQGTFALNGGVTYTFAFDAKASANRTSEIKVERSGTPWEDFSNIGDGQSLTNVMQRFSYTFTMPESVTNARMVMNLGQNNNNVTVDNVWLVEGSDDPCNGVVGCDNSGTDTDGDGVLDANDDCPTVPGPASNNGCPIEADTDGDGVLDVDDDCPTIPGPASNNGCPIVEEGLACSVVVANDWGNGGQLDATVTNNGSTTVNGWSLPLTFANNVTVTNFWNATISGSGNSYEVTNGEWNGTIAPSASVTFGFQISHSGTMSLPECGDIVGPVDTDGDGVLDADDACPLVAGPASNNGCPVETDTDGDGVLDVDDACPTVAGPASNNGCPLISQVPIRLEAEDYVRFQDFTAGNEGGACRFDDVDVETTSDSSECNVGWTEAGEWLEFDLTNVFAGTYLVKARVASELDGGLSVNGVSGSFTATGGWQTWETITLGEITVSATDIVRVTFDTDSVNLNWIELALPCNGDPTCTDSDNDGVVDANDLCPNTPPGTQVGADGCVRELGFTAGEANTLMSKGFNLGQMFEYTDQPIDFATSKAKIDAYHALGFNNVRLPITWTEVIHGNHLADPNTGVVDRSNSRLQTIQEIVDYALSLDLFVVMNMHHEHGIKNGNKTNVVEQVWADVADIFRDRDSRLIFEILNEPHTSDGAMDAWAVRELTTKAYDKIRAVSEDRIIVIGGNEWFKASELQDVWPTLEGVGNGTDPYVMATFHHYDPWADFHSEDKWPKDFAFDDNTVASQMDIAQNWANGVGGLPIYIGEWGVGWGKHGHAMTCNNIRLWYMKFGGISSQKDISTSVWDDGGWFKIFDNGSKSFNNNLAQCIAEGDCNWDADFTRNNAGCYL